jgi:hypothetical protein
MVIKEIDRKYYGTSNSEPLNHHAKRKPEGKVPMSHCNYAPASVLKHHHYLFLASASKIIYTQIARYRCMLGIN